MIRKMSIVMLVISVSMIFSSFTEIESNSPGQDIKKYAVKSGIVVYKSVVMGMNQQQTLYFDNYGAKEATESKSELFGMKTHTLNFIKDGYSYSVDFVNKTATKMKIDNELINQINYNELSEEIMREMKITKLGKEIVLGKECDKMSMNWTEMNMKGFVWVWKGISLKSEITAMGMKTLMEAVSIETDVVVPASKFEVPAGFQVTEQSMPSGFPDIDE